MKKLMHKITALLTCTTLMMSISSKVYADSHIYNDDKNYGTSLCDIDDKPVIPEKNALIK